MAVNPLVSIIINCFNGEKFLEKTIQTVLDQTYQNWELIFWDNQSTDLTAEIVKSHNDKRIKYIFAPNHTSLGEARNFALKEISGDLVSFLDSDDLWDKNRLKLSVEAFSEEDVGLVYSNGCKLYEDGSTEIFLKKIPKQGYVFEELVGNYTIMLGAAMVRRAVLEKLEYWFDNRYSMIEDFDFFIRIAKITNVAYVPDCLFKWRVHPGSLTWSKFGMFEEEHKIFLKEFVEKNPELKSSFCVKCLEARIAYHNFVNLWRKDGIPRRNIIKPYLKYDKRLIGIFFLSFLSLSWFEKALKFLGKKG